MASIPNLNTLRTGRTRSRLHHGGRGAAGEDGSFNESDAEAARDSIVQRTDHDATSSRMSAVQLGYLQDNFAQYFWPSGKEIPKRYPIINRGTYVRTQAIDRLVSAFLQSQPTRKKQVVSLGAGSDTRFLRFWSEGLFGEAGMEFHELDFETNVNQKRQVLRSTSCLAELIARAAEADVSYRLHAIDLRDLTAKSPPTIPYLDPELPTLLLSECCLCYLPPDTAGSVVQYFSMNITGDLALALYEPIRPFDPFGKTMVSNLASRGIHLQTLKRYCSLDAQRQRLRIAGFSDGQGARDVNEIWSSDYWTSPSERQRVESLEWLDEVEEWQLLASHYCVAWGWKGDVFGEAWITYDGGRSTAETKLDDIA